jgi:spore germination protein YaaH/N-acetyl-anhydromuramyl-L-alanine amidase AmpD
VATLTPTTSVTVLPTTTAAPAVLLPAYRKRPFIWAWIYSTRSGDVAQIVEQYGGTVIDFVSPDWYYLADDLSVGSYTTRGAGDTGFLELARSRGVAVAPMVVSSNADRVRRLITDPEAVERFANQLVDLARRYGYVGFNIDFEVSLPAYRAEFARFVDTVARRLHEVGLILTVAVPAKRMEYASSYLQTYDYELLARTAVDYVMIMAYDFYEVAGPKPVAPLWWVRECVEYALKFIPRERLVLGVPNYGKLWDRTGKLLKWLLLPEYQSMRSQGAGFTVDLVTRELRAEVPEGVAYYVDGEMAYYRAKLALEYSLAGVAVWRLDLGDPTLWGLLRNLRLEWVGPPDYPLAQWIEAYPGNYAKANRTDVRWVVIHVTEGSAQSAINWFLDPRARVSAHYIVSLGGAVYQMVREGDIAWHAGNRLYNSLSVGIEHEGFVKAKMFTEHQYRASARLLAYLAYKYGIPLTRPTGVAPADASGGGVIGHDQVPDPNNPSIGGGASHHTDPGPNWDWSTYMDLAERYYRALTGRYYEKAFVAVWWGVYSDRWSSSREVWLRQVEEALAKLAAAGVDAVFFLAKDPWGYVYYNSSYAPMSPKYSWDVLRDVIEMARRYGIEVYVYVNALSEGETEPNFLLRERPDLALYDSSGRMLGWVDPYCDEYVDRLLNIVREILTKYPEVRGIQLDRIRAPQSDVYGRCSAEKFRKAYGREPEQDRALYQRFLADGVTEVVRRVAEVARSLRPGIEVSAAVFPSPQAVLQVLQDWPRWVNEGILDYVVTMSYTTDFTVFKSYVSSQLGAIADPRKLLVGIGAWRLLNVQLALQLGYVVEELNLRGAVLFNVDGLLGGDLIDTVIRFRMTYYPR